MADVESSQTLKIRLTKEEYEQWLKGNLEIIIENDENKKDIKIKMDWFDL